MSPPIPRVLFHVTDPSHFFCRETWVTGSQCVTCPVGPRFNASKSSTYTPLGQSTTFRYGSGSIVADLAYETISMGIFKSEREVWCEHHILHSQLSPMESTILPVLLTLCPEDLHCVTIVTRIPSRTGFWHPRSWIPPFDGECQFRSVVDSSHSRRPTRPKRDFVCLLAL